MAPRTTYRDRAVAAGILLAGLVLALVVYIVTPPAEENDDVYDMEHSKMYLRQVEVIGGKSAVFTSELNESIESLFEGKTGHTRYGLERRPCRWVPALPARLRANSGGRLICPPGPSTCAFSLITGRHLPQSEAMAGLAPERDHRSCLGRGSGPNSV